jgi:uncharacterized peroxidase-related enzyme
LSAVERELLALVVSVENRCEVCIVTHAAALERGGVAKDLVDILAINWRRAGLNRRWKALAKFASRLTLAPAEADESHLEELRSAGLREREIFEAVQVVGVFNYTNRVNSALGVKLNREAHAAYRSG